MKLQLAFVRISQTPIAASTPVFRQFPFIDPSDEAERKIVATVAIAPLISSTLTRLTPKASSAFLRVTPPLKGYFLLPADV
ncbi:hypothetical protein [Phormidium sp. CCY1219]|uniref:hypothetical protein n=1 Tax=Phormidium sp. CCY1219 TaxID=2886104 RepID=UPI002D1EA6CA|nr:hypothetical protein [Phormidium sp. CCY1219]MEB3831066.1 hypothetical protein [Phormidium sp. CCY1219]